MAIQSLLTAQQADYNLQSVDSQTGVIELLSSTESYVHPMPKSDRITQRGEIWFDPASYTHRMKSGCDVVDHVGYPMMLSSTAQANDATAQTTGVKAIYPTAFTAKLRYHQLALQMPSDGLLQMPIYWPNAPIISGEDYLTIILFQRGDGSNNTLTNATTYYDGDVATKKYQFPINALTTGFNVLQLEQDSGTVGDLYKVPGRIVGKNISTEEGGARPLWDWDNPIIGIEIQWYGLPITDADGLQVRRIYTDTTITTEGQPLPLGAIYTQTKMKPLIMVIPDTANRNIYDNLVPIFRERNLGLTLRTGGDNAFRNTQFVNLIASNPDIDHYDGSWTRNSTINESTSLDSFLPQAMLGKQWLHGLGHHRGNILYSGAGNSIPSKMVTQRAFKFTGTKWAKAPTRQTIVTPITRFGLADPNNMTAIGYRGYNTALLDIEVVKNYGGILIWFFHECVNYADRTDTNDVLYDDVPSESGGGIYTEDAIALADTLRAGMDAGEYDVVSISQFDAIMNGIL